MDREPPHKVGKGLKTAMLRDHLKLQSIIFCWGFTAVLGALITLPTLDLVVWRTLIATAALFLMIRRRAIIPKTHAFQFFATGLIIGIHWIAFFAAVKVANVSVCMIGLATLSLWTALFEPLIIKNRKLRPVDLIFGILIAAAVYYIYRGEFAFGKGLLIALGSAIAGAVFSVINAFHVKKAHHHVITAYEMAGACAFTFIALQIGHFSDESRPFLTIPNLSDSSYLLILALACTVYPFSAYVELLKRLSVFSINFANNLEPVYGILLAALILKEHEDLTPSFYTGAVMIILCIIAYPIVRKALVRS